MVSRIGEVDGFECTTPNIFFRDFRLRAVEPVVPVGDRQEDVYDSKRGYDSRRDRYGGFSKWYGECSRSVTAKPTVIYGPDASSRETENGSYRVNLVA